MPSHRLLLTILLLSAAVLIVSAGSVHNESALAQSLLAPRCAATVLTDAIPLYYRANSSARVAGSASPGSPLLVEQVVTYANGTRWAKSPQGWFQPDTANGSGVSFEAGAACDVLLDPQPDATLAGLHLLNAMATDAVLDYAQRMTEAGYPIGTVKGLDGTEKLLSALESLAPQTITVYRSLSHTGGFGDCPGDIGSQPDPAVTARRWVEGLEPYWDAVDVDYYELINECPAGVEWLVQFSIEAMKVAQESGRCLLLFSFSVGSPQPDEFEALIPALRYALDNPCQPGRLHGLALHAYSMDDSVPLSGASDWLTRRYAILYDTLRPLVPDIDDLPVYLTEVGFGWGDVVPACDFAAADMVRYTAQLQAAPYVMGLHLWNFGPNLMRFDVSPCLPAIGDALIAYYDQGIIP